MRAPSAVPHLQVANHFNTFLGGRNHHSSVVTPPFSRRYWVKESSSLPLLDPVSEQARARNGAFPTPRSYRVGRSVPWFGFLIVELGLRIISPMADKIRSFPNFGTLTRFITSMLYFCIPTYIRLVTSFLPCNLSTDFVISTAPVPA